MSLVNWSHILCYVWIDGLLINSRCGNKDGLLVEKLNRTYSGNKIYCYEWCFWKKYIHCGSIQSSSTIQGTGHSGSRLNKKGPNAFLTAVVVQPPLGFRRISRARVRKWAMWTHIWWSQPQNRRDTRTAGLVWQITWGCTSQYYILCTLDCPFKKPQVGVNKANSRVKWSERVLRHFKHLQ